MESKESNAGRPSVMTSEVINKLEQAFMMGCSDKEACLYANISPATLYNYQQEVPEFLERKELLKESCILLARQEVIKGLKNNPDHALRFLERKKKDEFGLRTEHQHSGGLDLNHHNKKAEEMTDEQLMEVLAAKKVRGTAK